MATTAIWKVKGWLGKVLIYVENPNKTKNPKFYQEGNMNDRCFQGIGDLISYAMQEHHQADQEVMNIERYVSGINVSPLTARTEMQAVKKRFGKEDGIVAFHGYQSFSEGEVNPEIAHQIGIKLAEKLWGERFQIIVATHLDHDNHIHNHFVINSVSHIDGLRYHDNTYGYKKMREASDNLCREYGLSVIEDPENGKSRHYAEWRAERNGIPTWRSYIKKDIDEAIAASFTDKQFLHHLKEKGYQIKIGKDISVKPLGKERGFRLMRNFGEEYSYENICKKILLQSSVTIPPGYKDMGKSVVLRGKLQTKYKIGGLRGLYLYYCYRLKEQQKGTASPARAKFLFREDVRKLQIITLEAKLLCRHKIETAEQLFSYRSGLCTEMDQLITQRQKLRNKLRRSAHMQEEVKSELKENLHIISDKLNVLRKEVKLCDGIAERSKIIREKIKTEKRETEVKIDEYKRRSSRANRAI